jgi:hypothetical protein
MNWKFFSKEKIKFILACAVVLLGLWLMFFSDGYFSEREWKRAVQKIQEAKMGVSKLDSQIAAMSWCKKVCLDGIVSSSESAKFNVLLLEKDLANAEKERMEKKSNISKKARKEAENILGEVSKNLSILREFENARRETSRTKNDLITMEKEIKSTVPRFLGKKNHAESLLRKIENGYESAYNLFSPAKKTLTEVELLFESQCFEEIARVLETSDVKKAKRLLADMQGIIDQIRKLEQNRSDWPKAERDAANTISNEEDEVIKYGKHSSSAKSDFEEAKKLLKSARKDASQKYFVSAVEKAKKAENLADGAGKQAYVAYQDYEDRLRRSSYTTSDDDDDDSGSGSIFGGGSDGGFGGGDSDGWSGSSGGGDSDGWSGGSSGGGDGGGYSGSSGGGDGGGW